MCIRDRCTPWLYIICNNPCPLILSYSSIFLFVVMVILVPYYFALINKFVCFITIVIVLDSSPFYFNNYFRHVPSLFWIYWAWILTYYIGSLVFSLSLLYSMISLLFFLLLRWVVSIIFVRRYTLYLYSPVPSFMLDEIFS